MSNVTCSIANEQCTKYMHVSLIITMACGEY